jgi:hypothetical protein
MWSVYDETRVQGGAVIPLVEKSKIPFYEPG